MSYTLIVAHGLSFVVFCRFAQDGCALIVSIAGAFQWYPPPKKKKKKKKKKHANVTIISL